LDELRIDRDATKVAKRR